MEDLHILYEDAHVVLCVKPVGVLSEDSEQGACMPALLRRHYREQGKPNYIATVHRLDKIVGGVMLFSRRREVTGKLTAAVAEHRVTKEYLAVLRGHPAEASATLTDLLFRDASKNKSYVVKRMRKGVREASLEYVTLGSTEELTLVRVRLHTGRTHQIRVQFSSRGLPLLGDIRYGSKADCSTALWSYHMAFTHPVTGRTVDVTCPRRKAGRGRCSMPIHTHDAQEKRTASAVLFLPPFPQNAPGRRWSCSSAAACRSCDRERMPPCCWSAVCISGGRP